MPIDNYIYIFRADDQGYADSGVEMNGDTGTASNRTSYSSTIDAIDLKAIANSNLDVTDSNLKDHNTSSSETISPEKPKKKPTSSVKKTVAGTGIKKKVPASSTEKTTPNRTGSAKSRAAASGGVNKAAGEKTTKAAPSKTVAGGGVFDRLSGGSTRSRSSAVSRATSRESVMSQDDDKSKPKRSSINGKPNMNKSGTLPGDKITHKKVVRKSAAPSAEESPLASGGGSATLRRSASSINKSATAGRPKSQRSSLQPKSNTEATGNTDSEKGSFLKKMQAAKAAAVKASS